MTPLRGRCSTALLRTKILIEPRWFAFPNDSRDGNCADALLPFR
jgi:hypothetical protein